MWRDDSTLPACLLTFPSPPTHPPTPKHQTPKRDLDREKAALQTFLERTVREVQAHKAAWPFLEPVDTTVVTDYLECITDPIGADVDGRSMAVMGLGVCVHAAGPLTRLNPPPHVPTQTCP